MDIFPCFVSFLSTLTNKNSRIQNSKLAHFVKNLAHLAVIPIKPQAARQFLNDDPILARLAGRAHGLAAAGFFGGDLYCLLTARKSSLRCSNYLRHIVSVRIPASRRVFFLGELGLGLGISRWAIIVVVDHPPRSLPKSWKFRGPRNSQKMVPRIY